MRNDNSPYLAGLVGVLLVITVIVAGWLALPFAILFLVIGGLGTIHNAKRSAVSTVEDHGSEVYMVGWRDGQSGKSPDPMNRYRS